MSPVPPVIGTIEKACLYATDLTRQLLTFAKGSNPRRQVESLREVVREGVEFALHGSSLRCCFDLPMISRRSRWIAARFIRSSTTSSSTRCRRRRRAETCTWTRAT